MNKYNYNYIVNDQNITFRDEQGSSTLGDCFDS